jgi:hypothetical protein
MGLRHHDVKGFVDPAARLKPAEKEVALPKFWDGQDEVALLGLEYPPEIAVALRGRSSGRRSWS